jgi:hypothetical protein
MAYSEKRETEIFDYVKEHSIDKAAKFFGIKESVVERVLRLHRQKTEKPQKRFDFERTDEEGNIILNLVSSELKTVDELLAYSKIDTTIWEPSKVTTNAWGSGTNSNFQIKVVLKRIVEEEINIEEVCDHIIERIQKYSVPSVIKRLPVDKEGFLWEVGLADHHLGQLSWGKEVGVDYDVNIAQKMARDAVTFLCDKVTPYKINEIIYIIGNDYLNVSSKNNTTTGGTVQDEDGRYQRSFICGVEIHVDNINILKKIANVKVLQIPGNHSSEREYYLASVLQAWFRQDKNVQIDNRPLSRKYYRYGKNLLGFAHGDKFLKLDRLLGLMPIEAKEDWSLATNYEYHLGHLHHDAKFQHDLKTENGIKIRRLNTLVPLDVWHYESGYVRIRESQSFLWHKELGDLVHINYRP